MITKTQLLETLQKLQQENDKSITREFFRKTTNLFDSTWQNYFGSWIEFKAAAGLEQTKIHRKLYSDVSKHSELDKLRDYNTKKIEWDGKFLKPNTDRLQTIICGSDFHDRLCDPFHRDIFVDTVRRVKPNKIILNGDVLDLYEFSRYTKDPRKVDVMSSIKWAHKFLEDLREASPDSEIHWIEGNHEHRLIKLLAEATPSLLPILSDLHGMTVGSLLGLDKYEVNYVSKANLATFKELDVKNEIAKNYYIAYETVLFHHFPFAAQWGLAGTNGHHHSHKSSVKFDAIKGPYEWHQTGGGHIRNADYANGEKWTNGFLIIHVDTQKKQAQFDYVDTTYDFVCVGGKYYQRSQDQIVKL
jgi:hypothetical protein